MKNIFKYYEIDRADNISFISILRNNNWIFGLIPLLLFFGIVGQVMILSKYNAVVLFSWTQVLSDTIILIIPIIFGILGGLVIKLSANKIVFHIKQFILLIAVSVLTLILSLVFIGLNIYLLFLFGCYILGIFFYVSIHIGTYSGKKGEIFILKNESNFDLLMPSFGIIILTLFFILFFGTFNYIYNNMYYNIVIEPLNCAGTGCVIESVKYMNDKYIIYGDNNVMVNNGNYRILLNPNK